MPKPTNTRRAVRDTSAVKAFLQRDLEARTARLAPQFELVVVREMVAEAAREHALARDAHRAHKANLTADAGAAE